MREIEFDEIWNSYSERVQKLILERYRKNFPEIFFRCNSSARAGGRTPLVPIATGSLIVGNESGQDSGQATWAETWAIMTGMNMGKEREHDHGR